MANQEDTEKEKVNYSKGLHVQLPKMEMLLYACAYLCIVTSFYYFIYRDTKRYMGKYQNEKLPPEDLSSLLSLKKDPSEADWLFWYASIKQIFPFMCGHLLIGQIMEWLQVSLQKYVFTAFSALSLTYLFEWKAVAAIILQCVICFSVSLQQSLALIWIISVGMLTTLQVKIIWINTTLFSFSDDRIFSYKLLLCMSCLHCITFSLEKFNAKTKETDRQRRLHLNYSFSDLLFFTFYFPLCFLAPPITYHHFQTQITSPKSRWTKSKVLSIIFLSLRVLTFGVLTDLSIRLLYFSTLFTYSKITVKLSFWSLLANCYSHGQYFMMINFIGWGFSKIATRIEQIEIPDLPNCISSIYQTSDMWRHIYIPIGGSRNGHLRQVLASFMCFAFAFCWQGFEHQNFCWVSLNFIVVNLEFLGGRLLIHPIVKRIENEKFSSTMVRRLHAVCSTVTYTLFIWSLFYFFGGKEIGDHFAKAFFFEMTLLKLAQMFGFVYIHVQCCMEIKRIQQLRTNYLYQRPLGEVNMDKLKIL